MTAQILAAGAAIVTFVATLAFAPHLDNGILVGAGLAIGLYLYRTMTPRLAIPARHPDGTSRAAIEAANALTGLRPPLLDPQAVMSLYADDQFIHLVPSIDFDEQKQFREGTQAAEMIDYFAERCGTKTS